MNKNVTIIQCQILSDFDSNLVSDSNSDSGPDCNSVFMNLGIFVFLILYLDSSK